MTNCTHYAPTVAMCDCKPCDLTGPILVWVAILACACYIVCSGGMRRSLAKKREKAHVNGIEV